MDLVSEHPNNPHRPGRMPIPVQAPDLQKYKNLNHKTLQTLKKHQNVSDRSRNDNAQMKYGESLKYVPHIA